MDTHKNTSKKVVLALIIVMLLTIPNMSVYSAVGSYSTNSTILTANASGELYGTSVEKAAWLAAAAEAIALAYAAGYALGTLAHHAYDYFDGHPKKLAIASADYNASDFSKFDN